MPLPGIKLSAMANVFYDKKLKIEVIGYGGRGTGVANQALKAHGNVEPVVMADTFQDQLKKSLTNLQKGYEVTGKVNVKDTHKYVGFDGYKMAIDQADVGNLATPPGFRPHHFEYSVNAGKHIFMEKPMATDVPGIRKVLEISKVAKDLSWDSSTPTLPDENGLYPIPTPGVRDMLGYNRISKR